MVKFKLYLEIRNPTLWSFAVKPYIIVQKTVTFYRYNGLKYRYNSTFVSEINKYQSSWKAAKYPEYNNMEIEDLIRRAGGRKSKISKWDLFNV